MRRVQLRSRVVDVAALDCCAIAPRIAVLHRRAVYEKQMMGIGLQVLSDIRRLCRSSSAVAALLVAALTCIAQTPPSAGDGQPPDPERIARLQRTVEDTKDQLAKMQAELNDPDSEFTQAEREFMELDKNLTDLLREVEKLRTNGKEAEADARGPDLDALRKRWALSRERFQLAIEERRTQSEQIAALESKLANDQNDLAQLQGATSRPATPAASDVKPAQTGQPGAQPAATQPPSTQPPAGAAQPNGAQPAAQPAAPNAAAPQPAAQNPAPAQPAAQPPAQEAPPPAASILPQMPTSAPAAESAAAPTVDQEEVRKAKEKLAVRKGEAAKAAETATTLGQRIDDVRKAIDLEQKLQDTARKKAANAQETQKTLSEEVQKRWAAGAPKEELDDLWNKIADARKRYRESESDVMEGVDHVDSLQSELEDLQSQYIAALQEAAVKSEQAAAAEKLVAELSDPWHPQNVMRWLRDRGLRIAGIAMAMAVLLWIVRRTKRYMVQIMSRGRGTNEELENRARTLVGVFNNAATIAILVGGVLMVLTEIGMSVGPLLGGAAVVGLAVGLGAQNLIRDFFSGFMILLENQYGINDVVRINGLGGLVENITLRITVLRDIDGTAHFIPNGQINAVSNMTHGWSRAVFDIGISYSSDIDRAMTVLIDVGRSLRREPAYRDVILEDPEMLGVEALADSAVIIRFVIRTRPLKQWMVKREMLRRIKKRLDEEGIEIPFPHRTLYHRYDDRGAPPVEPPSEQIRSGRFASSPE